MARQGDTEGIRAGYRGGCGADTLQTEDHIPSSLPDGAYVLQEGERVDFPEDPREAIPDNYALRDTSSEEIIEYLETAITKFADKLLEEDNLGELQEVTGESKDMLRYDISIIRDMGSREYLEGLLQMGETDLSEYIEGWQKAQGYDERAVPLGKGVNVNAGHNVAAVIAPEIWRAVSKNAVMHKMPSSDQFTLEKLDETYRENPHPVADTFKAGYWPGGSKELERNLFSADYVMAWGDDPTIDSIKEKVAPTTNFVPFHFEFGAYLVDAETQENYDKELLGRIVADFSWGDQLLCFSPLLMAVEDHGDITDAFLEDVAEALEAYREEMELGTVPRDEKMKIAREKKTAQSYGELVSDFKNQTTVVLRDGFSENDLYEFFNFRFIDAHKVDSLEDAISVLGDNENLQEFILATDPNYGDDLRDQLVHTNAKRITAPGRAPPRQPIPWDGRHPINQLLKWVSDERPNYSE